MKKILGISLVTLLVATVVTCLLYFPFGLVKQVGNQPIKLSKQAKNKVVTKSSQSASTAVSATPEKQEEQAKWVKSDQPIKFPILMYHHIADVVGGNTLFVPASEFKMEMTALKKAGYYTLSPDEALRVLTTNEKPADKIVWVTFDDGYKNAQQAAAPILSELGMKGSFFIITGMVGNEDKMTQASLLEMKKNPLISLESHTVSHIDLQYATADEASRQLTQSKTYLDQLLHQNTSVICYPSGRYNDQTGDIATKAGYQLGLTTQPGLASRADGLFALHRVRVSYGQTESSFMSLIGN